jgi:hypothetical protein
MVTEDVTEISVIFRIQKEMVIVLKETIKTGGKRRRKLQLFRTNYRKGYKILLWRHDLDAWDGR